MFRTPFLLASLVLAAAFAGCGGKALAHCTDLETSPPSAPTAGNDVAVWKTNNGCFAVELYTGKAPVTAGNFVNLTQQGFYDGTRFHRVIDGFMIQDGDPLTKDPSKASQWGTGGPGFTIPDEFSPNLTHEGAGVLSMANTGQNNSGGSQYFITLASQHGLDAYQNGKLKPCGQRGVSCHAVFGKVLVGLDVVQAIGKVPKGANDRPNDDVVIDKITIVGA